MLNQSVFQIINSGNKEKKLGRNEKKFSQKHFLIIVSFRFAFFKKYFIMYLLNNKKFLFKKLFEEKNVPSERVKIL